MHPRIQGEAEIRAKTSPLNPRKILTKIQPNPAKAKPKPSPSLPKDAGNIDMPCKDSQSCQALPGIDEPSEAGQASANLYR